MRKKLKETWKRVSLLIEEWQRHIWTNGPGVHFRREEGEPEEVSYASSAILIYQIQEVTQWEGWVRAGLGSNITPFMAAFVQGAASALLEYTNWDGSVKDEPYISAIPASQSMAHPGYIVGITTQAKPPVIENFVEGVTGKPSIPSRTYFVSMTSLAFAIDQMVELPIMIPTGIMFSTPVPELVTT